MYTGIISPKHAIKRLVSLLLENGIKTRDNNHILKGGSYWVYDKEDWALQDKKPLGLGLIYKKSDGTKTQDIFIANPGGSIERYYSDADLKRRYPSLIGTHKQNLPIKMSSRRVGSSERPLATRTNPDLTDHGSDTRRPASLR